MRFWTPTSRLEPEDPEEAALLRAVQAPLRRRARLGSAFVALCCVALLAVPFRATMHASYRRLRFAVLSWGDTSELGKVDLEQLHASTLPLWMIANAAWPPDAALEAETFARLRDEVASNDTLLELVSRMRTLTADPGEINGYAEILDETVDRWNGYLERQARPWWIDGSILPTTGGPRFILKSYRVQAEVQPQVGDRAVQVRLVSRVDPSNVVEGALGRTFTGRGAVILLDRIYDLAIDSVWPLLDAAGDPAQAPSDRAFAPFVREEVGRALSAEALVHLRATARDRTTLMRAAAAIEARRECGSPLSMHRIPLRGLDDAGLEALERYAAVSGAGPCPPVMTEEVQAMREASRALAAAEGLEPAIGELTAWLARGTAIHEARHVADRVGVGPEALLGCAGCATEMPGQVRLELSAYLAGFADPATGYTALYRACMIVGSGGAHGRAMEAILERLDPAACERPPEVLGRRALELERVFFVREEPVTLPAGFPRSLAPG